MAASGYYRFPTIHDDTVVFVCEDDLWTAPAAGGIARRLTSNLGEASWPALAPDGANLAFIGRDEGAPEVYVMPAQGGPARRLTFLGATTRVVGWTPDGLAVVLASDVAQPLERQYRLYAAPVAGGEPRMLPTGPAISISFGPAGGQVIGRRNSLDLAYWKRYRGGTAGDIWIDADGSGAWRRLLNLPGNVALPLWVGDRIYFIADHEGVGNLYSCLPTGEDVRRHTGHSEYYVRSIASDGRRIVYTAGADLFVFDPFSADHRPVAIQFHSPQVQRNRKFVDAAGYLQSYDVHPRGHSVGLTARGQSFTMANWEGAVSQHGADSVAIDDLPVAVRHRLTSWLHDGLRIVVVSDAEGEDALELYQVDGSEAPRRLSGLDIGRPMQLRASPARNQVAFGNHRNELVLVDLETSSARLLDRSPYGSLQGLDWSPDGLWLAYGFPNSAQTSIIKLCQVDTGETWEVTRPVLRDGEPAFDPDGKYLYFLSAREFDPVYDALHFDLNFPRGMRPYLVTLQKDLPSPFIPEPRAPGEKPGKKNGNDANHKDHSKPKPGSGEAQAEPAPGEASAEPATGAEKSQDKEKPVLHIDLEGISERIVAFPVDDARYSQIRGIEGKALFSWRPIEGSLDSDWRPSAAPSANAVLEMYDFGEQKHETLIDGISSFGVSLDGKTLIYRAGNRLRVLKAGEKPENKGNASPSRQSGWLDLDRLKVAVLPGAEWAQMYRHAWRLQRDHFWSEDMSGVDWQQVYRRYWPLLGRVASRSEFSDLMWEMQGELGTSHAYEFGGDYKPAPDYTQGFLGADFTFDEASGGYRVARLVQGDPWDEDASSPMRRPGLNIAPGDILLAVNGRRLSADFSPQQALVNHADEDVQLVFAGRNGEKPRAVTVKTLRNEHPARYRQWVEANRRRVHEATAGRVGYLHIPDMGPHGYAEFHRGYLAEVVREGLIVDVRYNRGGHVSQLLLEKLARKRIGYDVQRWGPPEPYPSYAVLGPVVALTNEYAGSDGDIFCHAFKLMKLGTLIGKRTWGGVIGISPKEILIDGSVTTQPEYSFWFQDVGWGVENYGAEPDIEVEIAPQDWVAGRDPQMERALAEITRLLEENPPALPDFSNRPRLGLPDLPV